MRIRYWAILLAVVIAYAGYSFATLDRREDSIRISTMLFDAAKAIENSDLNGTIKCISKNYKDDGGLNYDRLRMLAAQAAREEMKVKVSLDIDSIEIASPDATVKLSAEVKNVSDNAVIYQRDLVLHLKKSRFGICGLCPQMHGV